jgi:hypothetical protein
MTVISIKIKHISDFIFYSMISTVVLVFAYFLVRVMQFSFSIALFKDGADISYIILSLPFVLFGIRARKKINCTFFSLIGIQGIIP